DTQKGFVNYLRIANGMITQTRNLEIKKKLDESDEELLIAAIAEIRNMGELPASELILPFKTEWEQEGVKIAVPQIGDRKKLLELSLKNAFYYKKERVKMAEALDPTQKTDRILETMKQDLRLMELPRHIEC